MDSWIAEQIAAKRKDSQIINDLVRNGWHLEDAQKALAAVKESPEPRMNARDYWFFGAALLGIFLCNMYLLLGGRISEHLTILIDNLINASFDAILFIIALTLVTWVLYALAIKHSHPKLHRAFYLWIGTVIGIGSFCWLILLTIFFCNLVYLPLAMWAIIAVLSLYFATSVGITEYIYSILRNRYDNAPIKDPMRLTIMSAVVFVAVFFALSMTAYEVTSHIMVDANKNAIFALPASVRVNASIANPILRQKFLEHQSLPDPQQYPLPTMFSTLTDQWVNDYCSVVVQNSKKFHAQMTDAKISAIYPLYKTNNITQITTESFAYATKPQPPQTGSGSSLAEIFPVETALDKNAQACGTALWLSSLPYTTLSDYLTNPDLNDPDQRDLAGFIIWYRNSR